MRLLDRYLLRELLIPLGYCLCGFLLFWITSDLFVTLGEFQKKGLVARDIAEYYLSCCRISWCWCCRSRCCWRCSTR